jgi:hypothetical protein
MLQEKHLYAPGTSHFQQWSLQLEVRIYQKSFFCCSRCIHQGNQPRKKAIAKKGLRKLLGLAIMLKRDFYGPIDRQNRQIWFR